MSNTIQNKQPLSLKDFLRKRLMLGSQCPSIEEEADWYIRQLAEHMKTTEPTWYVDWGGESAKAAYNTATMKMLKILKGEGN